MPGTESDRKTSAPRTWSPPEAHLFVVLDGDRPSAGGLRCSLRDVDEVLLGRTDAYAVERGGPRASIVGVPDRKVSSRHARIVREAEGWVVEDAGSTNGTSVNGQAIRRTALRDGDLVSIGRTILALRLALPTPPATAAVVTTDDRRDEPPALRTLIPALAAEHALVAQVAGSAVPVILLGETGTGKELTARAIHERSKRDGAIVPVNCAAIPANLVESQFFGHARGAFSGATQAEPGLVRAADRGTLFLDEIGDLPRAAQGVLLRVLQEREVTPVGATKPIRVDVRVIAATHQPLAKMIDDGDFRRDLFARLDGFSHRLWPLRDRREDIGVLVADILSRIDGAQDVRLGSDAALALVRHAWPLNVRELAQALARGVTLATDGVIEPEHLPIALTQGTKDEPAPSPEALSPEDAKLRASLLEHLARCDGNVAAVARDMKKAPMQIYRWMRRLKIDPGSFR